MPKPTIRLESAVQRAFRPLDSPALAALARTVARQVEEKPTAAMVGALVKVLGEAGLTPRSAVAEQRDREVDLDAAIAEILTTGD